MRGYPHPLCQSLKPPSFHQTYPARPVNGGPLDKALTKAGLWCYKPKLNGWRALVHLPTGTVFNRHGKRLSIEGEFTPVLTRLREHAADLPE